MKKLRVSHLAEADLDEIWLFVATDRPGVADKLLDRFRQQFLLLMQNPELGEQREDLATDLRQMTVGNYIVLYLIQNEWIEVARVIHGARDIPVEYRRRFFGK